MIGIKLRETVEIVNFVWCQCCKPLTAVQAMTDIFIWMATHSWTAKKNSLTRHWQLMLWDQGEIKIIAVKLPCLTICHRWPLLPIPNHPPPPRLPEVITCAKYQIEFSQATFTLREVLTETLSSTDLVDEPKLLKGYTPKLHLKQEKVLQKTPWCMFMAVTCSGLWAPVYFHFSRWFSSHKLLDNLAMPLFFRKNDPPLSCITQDSFTVGDIGNKDFPKR